MKTSISAAPGVREGRRRVQRDGDAQQDARVRYGENERADAARLQLRQPAPQARAEPLFATRRFVGTRIHSADAALVLAAAFIADVHHVEEGADMAGTRGCSGSRWSGAPSSDGSSVAPAAASRSTGRASAPVQQPSPVRPSRRGGRHRFLEPPLNVPILEAHVEGGAAADGERVPRWWPPRLAYAAEASADTRGHPRGAARGAKRRTQCQVTTTSESADYTTPVAHHRGCRTAPCRPPARRRSTPPDRAPSRA